MKKLIHSYLDCAYPNVYIHRTKFGDAIYDNKLGFEKIIVVHQLRQLFSCGYSVASDELEKWILSRPVYVRVTNATNEDVLVPLETKCNSTAI